ncbi:MAG: pyridoxamine 5'-phosphate oxidase family protein [Clostridia bacterium]
MVVPSIMKKSGEKMFRPIRRIKQQTSNEKCIEILGKEPRGVLAVHGEDGYPYAFPMNHIYIDGKLYFHSAKQGHKVDVLEKDDKVSYCIMDKGEVSDDGWSLNFNSVIIFGKISVVKNEEQAIEIIRKLALKNYPTDGEIERIIKESAGHFYIYELSVNHMTGKFVNES